MTAPSDDYGKPMLPIGTEHREQLVTSASRVVLERRDVSIEVDLLDLGTDDDDKLSLTINVLRTPRDLHLWADGYDLGAIDAEGNAWGAPWVVTPTTDLDVREDDAAVCAGRAIERLAKKWSVNPVAFATEVLKAFGEVVAARKGDE
jgi:hypothetical protein